MPTILLLQFDTDSECSPRRELLKAISATLVEGEPRWPIFFDIVTKTRPDVIVIALRTLSQHGREAARYLGDGFNTRDIPVLLVDVEAKEVERTRRSAPAAAIVDRSSLAAAVRAKLGNFPVRHL